MTAADNHIIVGQQNHLVLTSTGTACIDSVTADGLPAGDQKLDWKPGEKANTVEVSVTLKTGNPGELNLAVHQYGREQPDSISAQTFAKAADLKGVEYHVGDRTVTLTGTNLAEVRKLDLGGSTFTSSSSEPQITQDVSHVGESSLILSLADGAGAQQATRAKGGDRQDAKVTLADGRVLTLPVVVQPQRPTLSILNKRSEVASPSAIQLLGANDVALDSRLILSLRSGDVFPRDAQIEVASEDRSLHNERSIGAGTLVLLDRRTVLAQIDLRKTFGDSAFGPLQVRIVTHDGVAGDWLPLATLVRLPVLSSLHCNGTGDQPCSLAGSDLYLVKTVSVDDTFSHPLEVPDGFVGATLDIPRPNGPVFYLKLRDDPASAASVTLPVTP